MRRRWMVLGRVNTPAVGATSAIRFRSFPFLAAEEGVPPPLASIATFPGNSNVIYLLSCFSLIGCFLKSA